MGGVLYGITRKNEVCVHIGNDIYSVDFLILWV